MRLVLYLLMFLVVSGCSTMPSVESLKELHTKEIRVDSVSYKILSSNLDICPERRKDYGFKAMWLLQGQDEERTKLVKEAYGVRYKPTITTIIPNASFDRAGVRVGDSIISVNGAQWSGLPEDRSNLIEELVKGQRKSSLKVGLQKVSEGKNEPELLVVADEICDAYATLVNDPGAYAYAQQKSAYIESGLLDLLDNDNELAFFLSHEFSHVILKHQGAANIGKKRRALNEREADEMAIQLMVNGGYSPSGAYTALRKFDEANRGPITRMLGLYGIYMPTEERIEFLKGIASKVSEYGEPNNGN